MTSQRPAGIDTETLSWVPASSATTLTYTSAPLPRTAVLDGPSDVTIYATSSAPDVQLTATLNAIAPDGTITKYADGVLIGSQRQLDPATSWYGANHTLLQPSHPFTEASRTPVTPGVTTPRVGPGGRAGPRHRRLRSWSRSRAGRPSVAGAR